MIRQLRAENKGSLLVYSVEDQVDVSTSGTRSLREPVHKRIVQEMIRSIDVAADFEDSRARANESSGRRTWVAIKLVRLFDVNIVTRMIKVCRFGHAECPFAQLNHATPPIDVSFFTSFNRPCTVSWLSACR